MTTANQLILDGAVRHAHWLERYNTGVVSRIISLLNKADDDLVSQIQARLGRINGRGYNLSKVETQRLKELLDDIRKKRVELYGLLYEETKGSLSELAIHEAGFQQDLLQHATNSMGKAVSVSAPSLNILRSVALSRPFQGRLLKDWYKSLPEQAGNRIADAVQMGIVEGQTTDQIVRRIVGSRALRYKDGILEMNRRDAEAVVRTSVAHTANNAAEELYKANADLVLGVRWVSTLDSRTTSICASRDGQVFAIGEGPRPPAHWRCRSTTVPDLGEEETGTRASSTGQVPAKMNYAEWLKKQQPKVQDEILGPARGKLFRDGGLPIDKFVDVTGKSYTLQQLKELDSEIFDKAFAPRKADSPEIQKKNLQDYLGSKTYDNFKSYVNNAMENSGVEDFGMSEAEKVAVYAYTSGDKYYARLNKALRSEKAADIARVSKLTDVLDSALAKLPKYEGITSRVTKLSPETLAKIKETGQYRDMGYMSSSVGPAPSWVSGNVEFTIIAKAPRLIHGYSQFPHEREALFQRARKFEVLQITERKGQKTLIEMVEIDE